MHEYDQDDIDALKEKRICFRCVGEDYLSAEIRKDGDRRKCAYCHKTRQSFALEDMATRVDTAFEQHFQLTSDQPNSMERMMLSDREFDYDWDRHGDPVAEAIGMAAVLDEEPANDIQQILAAEYSDREMAAMGEETPYEEGTYYEEKPGDSSEWERLWLDFTKSLKEEARFFNPLVDEALRSIFRGIDEVNAALPRPFIVQAGPGTDLTALFRARVFLNLEDLEHAIKRPDIQLGPPPAKKASAGRMNAHGISVFYGATDPKVAVAEVRPPVGSRACVARFILTRELKLLDLTALTEASETGSLFDPSFIGRFEKALFLRKLTDKLTVAVMQGDEHIDYLPTQVVADFLSSQNEPTVDGMIFPSVQAASAGLNVVLFRKASRVEELQLPPGTEIDAYGERYGEEGSHPDYFVSETVPAEAAKVSDKQDDGFHSILQPTRWFDQDADFRESSLRIDLDSLEVHAVTGIVLETYATSVRRYRTTKVTSSIGSAHVGTVDF